MTSKLQQVREALEHIVEYWNGNRSDGAMWDALQHILETAEQALTATTHAEQEKPMSVEIDDQRWAKVRERVQQYKAGINGIDLTIQEIESCIPEPPTDPEERARDERLPITPQQFGLVLLPDHTWITEPKTDVMALVYTDSVGMFARATRSIPFTRDDVIKALMAYFKANRGEGATHDN